jgi:hypothetical protein
MRCPYCRVLANFTQRHMFQHPFRGAQTDFYVWTCDSCGGPILGRVEPNGITPADYHPRYVPDERFPDVPPAIAADAGEAFRCFGIEAWKASAAMARRALQAAAYERGAPDTRLIDQIDWLAENGHITEQMKDVAHRIRLGGNLGAHPDRDGLADVGRDDVAALLSFLRDFFRYVYEIPASLDRLAGGAEAAADEG